MTKQKNHRPNKTFWLKASLVSGTLLWCALALVWAPSAEAGLSDNLRREAASLERKRDCEGAYLKYKELRRYARARGLSSTVAFAVTKMMRLRRCYNKCTPTNNERKFIKQAQDFRSRGQNRRAYRMLLRLLRGKNPRCRTWREPHRWRRQLARSMRRRKSQRSVDPCEMEDETKQKLATTKAEVAKLEQSLAVLQKPYVMPAPPTPPRWARKGRRYRYWLRRWKRRTRRKMRRRAERNELQRLQQILTHYRSINDLRETIFNLRENFQNCDEVYAELKTQSQSLRKSQTQAHGAVVALYDGRVKRFRSRMRYFAGRYYRLRRNQKTDRTSVQSLRQALQQQRELLDNVTQDLLALSNLLVFKPKKAGEGTLLQNNMGDFQKLMSDQSKMFAALQKQFPGYMQSDAGRKQLSSHLLALGRFEKVLERFQDRNPGEKSDKIRKTLLQVRGSILLLEKAEKTLAQQNPTAKTSKGTTTSSSGKASVLKASGNVAGGKNRGGSPWGWLLLSIGLVLALGASWYLWREHKMRTRAF